VAAGGEIDVLDPAGYGALTISKAISIQGHGFSGIGVAGGGTAVTVTAGTSDAVALYGLVIEGAAVGQTGILFNSGQTLVIDDCIVRNFTASGIALAPTTTAQIRISSTLVTDNGGHGIQVQPVADLSTTTFVDTTFERVEVYRNAMRGIGIFGNSAVNSWIWSVAVDCVSAHNQTGFYVLGNNGIELPTTRLRVLRSVTFGNGQGITAEAQAFVFVSQSNIEDDGWSSNGGSLWSYGDNYSRGVAVPGNLLAKH